MEAKFNSGLTRCPWCSGDPLYMEYHDKEWGKLVKEDNRLFEFLILEGAQAGLSWLTVLKKRENYRIAFHNFDYMKVSEMNENEINDLMKNKGIIRNRLKIKAAINNAILFADIVNEFGSFYNYIISFFPGGIILNNEIHDVKNIPVRSEISDSLSKDLKKRGFKFVGSTICYSFLQATGFINDHLTNCAFK